MLSFVVALSFISAVVAFPNGAPICAIGPSVVRNEHVRISRNPQTGTIEKEGYTVLLNGNPLLDDPLDATQVNLFQFGEQGAVTILSPTGRYFKGVLMIVHDGIASDVDLLNTKEPAALNLTDANTKPSAGCATVNVASMVQVINTQKTLVGVGLTWPVENVNLFMDTTIVINNNATVGSQYYFTQYPMRSADIVDPTGPCGLLGLGIFCPLSGCGLFGRLLGLCDSA